jgi:hypothetical protein
MRHVVGITSVEKLVPLCRAHCADAQVVAHRRAPAAIRKPWRPPLTAPDALDLPESPGSQGEFNVPCHTSCLRGY